MSITPFFFPSSLQTNNLQRNPSAKIGHHWYEVSLKTGFESRGVSGFRHGGQRLDELIFRAVKILELFNEKLL